MAGKWCLVACLAVATVLATRAAADKPAQDGDAAESQSIIQESNIQELEQIRQQREAFPGKAVQQRSSKRKSKSKGKKKGNGSTGKGRKGRKRQRKNQASKRNKSKSKKKRNGKGSKARKDRKKQRKNKARGAKKSKKNKQGNGGKRSKARKDRKRQRKNQVRGAKKSKKNKRGKGKGGKAPRKNRKNDKRRAGKGSRRAKLETRMEKGRRNKGHKRSRQSTAKVNLTCLKDAVTFTKFLKDNVVNFLRRNTRLTAQNTLTNKKAAKKGEYKEPAARLIQAGNGDKTNLSCSGSTTSVGAKKMKAVTDILDGCEIGIKKACKPPDSINTTTLDKCKENAIKYNTTVNKCIMMATKGEDACSCFQDPEVLKEKKVLEKCKGKDEAKAAAKARTACLKVIKECKNASTNAATLQYACSYTTEHLLKTLKQLTANLAQFGKLMDKIKELTGLAPTVGPQAANSTRTARSAEESEEEAIFDSHQARLRGKRQQQACSTITTTITTCTTTISNKPASVEIITKCKTPTFTIGTCTDDDKKAIQEALNDAVDKNAIIIAFIASVTAELKEVTGTTPKASDLTGGSGGETTGKASARSRSVLRKMIMDKMSARN